MMRIALTGISGHIGNNLTRILLDNDYSVKGLLRSFETGINGKIKADYIVGDLSDSTALDKLCEDADVLIHLAGKVSIYPSDKEEIYNTNIEGVKNVIDACLRNGIKKIIHFSSIHAHEAYGPTVAINESTKYVESESSPYDYSKSMGEQLMIKARQKGLDICILNPTGVLGPNDFQPSLTGKMMMAIYQGNFPMIIKGGFDWVDVRDISEAVISILKNNISNEKFILSGHWAEIKYIAQKVSVENGKNYSGYAAPMFLAKIGLPFIQLYANLLSKPPLYTTQSLKAIEFGSTRVEHFHAKQILNYSPRSIDDTLKDSTQWLIKHFSL